MHLSPSSSAPRLTASAERARVARHLARAEKLAQRADVSALSFLQRLVRALLLDELADYRWTGRFPRNTGFADHTPCFVDRYGTPCAVAHLLMISGEAPLVRRIARQRNHARVRELADEPRLVAWLAAAGLSLHEAAAIQPNYCYERSACICGDWAQSTGTSVFNKGVPASGVLVGTMLRTSGAQLVMRIDRTYGDPGTNEVGRELTVTPAFNASPAYTLPMVGNMLVVPVHKHDADAGPMPSELTAIALSADGTFSCKSHDFRAVGPMQAEQLATILQAADCEDAVDALNPKWTQEKCDEEMCSFSPGATRRQDAPATLDILLVLVSTLVARRMTRRGSCP